jgi:hypothetical protein
LNSSIEVDKSEELAGRYASLRELVHGLVNTAALDDFLSSNARHHQDLAIDALPARFNAKVVEVTAEGLENVDDAVAAEITDELYALSWPLKSAMKNGLTFATPLTFGFFGVVLAVFCSKYFVPLSEMPTAAAIVVGLSPLLLFLWGAGCLVGGIFVRRAFAKRLAAIYAAVDDLVPFAVRR